MNTYECFYMGIWWELHLHYWSLMSCDVFNCSWEVIDSVQEGKSASGSPFTDSWMNFKLFIEETSSFKQQNPGKVRMNWLWTVLYKERQGWNFKHCICLLSQFCLLVCSMCSFLAILGRYIPGVVISYILGKCFIWSYIKTSQNMCLYWHNC